MMQLEYNNNLINDRREDLNNINQYIEFSSFYILI